MARCAHTVGSSRRPGVFLLALGLASLLVHVSEVQADSYQGTALIEGGSGPFLQRATSFTPNPYLPRDFSTQGVLAPGNYAVTFESLSSGNASDDPRVRCWTRRVRRHSAARAVGARARDGGPRQARRAWRR
jgi:hypothetical protein